MTTAVIAHRDTLVAAALRTALSGDDIAVHATCTTFADVRAACDERPGVVLAGTQLDDGALHHHVTGILSTTSRVVVICDDPADPGVRDALLAGASGCLPLRHTDATHIRDAVHTVATGQAALHPTVAATVLAHWRRDQQRTRTPLLTARERQVLRAMCDGLTTTSAARSLGIATKTVEAHKSRLFAKLGVRTQTEAVAIATRERLLGSL